MNNDKKDNNNVLSEKNLLSFCPFTAVSIFSTLLRSIVAAFDGARSPIENKKTKNIVMDIFFIIKIN